MERLTKKYEDGTFGVADNLPCGENSNEFKRLLIKALGSYEHAETKVTENAENPIDEILKERWFDEVADVTFECDMNGKKAYDDYIILTDPDEELIKQAYELMQMTIEMREDQIDDKFLSTRIFIDVEGNKMIYGYIATKLRRIPIVFSEE